MEWQPSGAGGFWLKPLFEHPEGKLKTWLMKIDPGAYSPIHAGDMIVRATRALHEAGSETGALALGIYAPAKNQVSMPG